MPINYDLDTFATDYFNAREKFLSACSSLPGNLESFQHPTETFNGQPLVTDIFWLGPEAADRVIVVISATHGVEGFCGSAAQVNWLKHETLPDDNLAFLFIHALNPYGFAHCCRVDENNIDLNRNFIDFTDIPINSGYQQLSRLLQPSDFSESTMIRILEGLEDYRDKYGQQQTETAVSGGQYQYPDGLFYGGQKPSWSRQTVEAIIQKYDLSGREHVIVIDIHSGLGPYGYGELISDHFPNSEAATLAKRWFGDSVTEPMLGTSSSVPKMGLQDYCWHQALADKGCYLTLEFGTYSVESMFALLCEENSYRQMYYQGRSTIQLLSEKQRKLRDFFFPDKTDWKHMVLFRSEQVIGQAISCLKQENKCR